MVDSKNLISLPPWVRALLIGILLALFVGSAWLVLTNVGKAGFRDWFQVSMSILQMAATGLLFGLVLFFAEADVSVATLREAFGPTFSGARNVGWGEVVYQPVEIDGRQVTSIWTTWMIEGEGFLKSPEKQLFVAQDIAMMTQSILRSATRNKVPLVVGDHWPRPL